MAVPLTSYPWTDTYELGHARMDDTHREFVDFIDTLLHAGDQEFPALLARFAVHTQQHFDQESAWMRETDFPPAPCHELEHQRVLEAVRVVGERVAGGDLALGRQLVVALAEWFPVHAASMDGALAGWLLRHAEARDAGGCCAPAPAREQDAQSTAA